MLNADHYTLLAGNPKKWDDEMRSKFYFANGDIKPMSLCIETLPRAQERQHREGRRSVEIFPSAGDDFRCKAVIGDYLNGVVGSYEHVVKVASAWANEDPDNREVFVRKSMIPLNNG